MCYFLSLQVGVTGFLPLLSFPHSHGKRICALKKKILSADVQGVVFEQYFSVVP